MAAAAKDETSQQYHTAKLVLSPSPGNFFLFWNVIVPVSILLNIRHFGLRVHEFGLLLALSLNDYILNFIIQHSFLSWIVLMFIIIWIERILKRWSWYRIYTFCFFKNLLLFFGFILVPAAIIKFAWPLLAFGLQGIIKYTKPSLDQDQMVVYTNIGLLTFSITLLLLSLYFHNHFKGVCVLKRIFQCQQQKTCSCPQCPNCASE